MKSFYAGVFAISFAAGLAGCATVNKITSATIPQKDVVATAQTFDLAETGAKEYLLLPTCVTGQTILKNGCKTQASAAKLAADVRTGRDYRNQILAASKASADGSISATYGAYVSLKSIVSVINNETGK